MTLPEVDAVISPNLSRAQFLQNLFCTFKPEEKSGDSSAPAGAGPVKGAYPVVLARSARSTTG